jgi:hypothetical protein
MGGAARRRWPELDFATVEVLLPTKSWKAEPFCADNLCILYNVTT